MVSRWLRNVLVAAGAVALASWVARAQTPGGAAAHQPAIATVGSLKITRAEFEARAKQAMEEYKKRSGAELPEAMRPMARRQILEGMIRVELLQLEAQRLGMRASVAEAEAQLKHEPFFRSADGSVDERKFEAVKAANSPQFQEAVATMRERLAARTLNDRLERESTPDSTAYRKAAEHELMRATLDYLPLRRSDFSGAYREPREREVLDYYRRHADQFRLPARAVLTVASIEVPALPEQPPPGPAATQAWSDRMRASADSVIRAVRGGASLEELAATYGLLRPGVEVLPDNFPGFWHGDAKTRAAVFAARPGSLLDEPVRGADGWLVVRVDQRQPSHVPSLAEVAKEIRTRLREDSRLHSEERELRALYEARKDSLRTLAVMVRVALIDTSGIEAGKPSSSDLDRFYRGHLADYSSFDSEAGRVVEKPFDQVQDDVRRRWAMDRRVETARALAERLEKEWSRNRRDRSVERQVDVRELGALPIGARVEAGPASSVLTDSVSARGSSLGAGFTRTPRGFAVFQIYRRVPNQLPTFEQAMPRLRRWHQAQVQRTEEAGARALYDADPKHFATGRTLHFGRFLVQPQDLLTVPISHQEVERYYHEHIDRYSAPELVTASHILISPKGTGPGADAAAKTQAEGLLRRIHNGEDFSELAREFSDDDATKSSGGDLGTFGHGTYLPELEHVVFSMRPGDVSDVVHTEVGYDIVKCRNYLPPIAKPLPHVYANVTADLANEKADSLAKGRADSLFQTLHSPEQAREVAHRLKLQMNEFTRAIGARSRSREMDAYFRTLDATPAGHLYPGAYPVQGQGYAITWVDTVTAATAPTWQDARQRALEEYRLGAGLRALRAKEAELDSMVSSGWTLDSLVTLWGGWEHLEDVKPGTQLPGLGGADVVDSLVFGSDDHPVVPEGAVSGWVELPRGDVRIRVTQRKRPSHSLLAIRTRRDLQLATQRAMEQVFDRLKRRFPVRILDARLRELKPPAIPEPGQTRGG